MGVVNLTPDSFFDGGQHLGEEAARARVDALIAEGAQLLDLGAESTRPCAVEVPATEQIRRLSLVLDHAVSGPLPVSVDTTSAEVADWALRRGASIINDVSCLADPELASVAARHRAILIVMHSRGSMSQMKGFSVYPEEAYGDVVADVIAEWSLARDRAIAAGLSSSLLWFDPGLGFAKSAAHSTQLLGRLRDFAVLGCPIVVGASRKSFLASADGSSAEQRLGGSIAAAVYAAAQGAQVLRVHDVRETRQALRVTRALEFGGTTVCSGI
jgi:dihydropteroate synthase